ncbi:MAG TPA: OmpA family protein [Kofleriaceae bacterium]|nr:OmpA family protein [Kofleriaceae bacterium]
MSQRTWTAMALALGLAGLQTACGVNKATHQKVLDDLTECQSELSATRDKNSQQETRIGELETALSSSKAEGSAADKARAQLLAEKKATEAELVALRKQRDATEARMKAYRELTEKFRALVDTGKLKVEFRNGQMVLNLPSEVLFPSGRARLSKGGEAALKAVLDVLLQFKDRRFMVAGHTDNRAIHTKRFSDNWALSTARAVSVVEAMVTAGFDPTKLAAAGYGEHSPVASNDTKEGRTKNRRIEIILVPNLSELPDLKVPEAAPEAAKS